MVASKEFYYIRARITKMNNHLEYYPNYVAPCIKTLSVAYDYENSPQYFSEIFAKSNSEEYKVELADKKISHILKKELYEYPAMYFCLSRPIYEGTVKMFVDVEDGIHRFNPNLKWEYCADDHMGGYVWKHIDVMDLTEAFSHSGTITMIGRNDFKETIFYGATGYFLRIINTDKKYSENKNILTRAVINDIKFNAVEVIQRYSKKPEYFSIEQDEENKSCMLSSNDIGYVEVWVDELGKISTVDQENYMKKSNICQVENNELGEIEKLWIKWTPVSSIFCADVNDRVYEVDYSRGKILFGNGKNGKIPPAQYSQSIRVNYSVCNGSKGNIGENEIDDFIGSIPEIIEISNPSPIMGGVDMETIESAADRVFSQISTGNRLISLNDFEEAIKFNDKNIYKIKCLLHVNENDEQEIGITSIAILPRNFMKGYDKFQGIKKRAFEFIDEKAVATFSKSAKIKIFEAFYVETIIAVDVVISDFNYYQNVHNGIRNKLLEFLNPITGNFSKKGWEIGNFPRKELIYNCIKTVAHIKWIKKTNIFTKIITNEGNKEIDYEKILKKNFVVPVFAEPEINISVNPL
jgi:hypothetical protein